MERIKKAMGFGMKCFTQFAFLLLISGVLPLLCTGNWITNSKFRFLNFKKEAN